MLDVRMISSTNGLEQGVPTALGGRTFEKVLSPASFLVNDDAIKAF